MSRKSRPNLQLKFNERRQYRDQHGGSLRQKSWGRGARPLSTRHSLHVVFKLERGVVPRGLRHPKSFLCVSQVVAQYARRFGVGVAQMSVQRDHIHILVRARRRYGFQHFFRVVAGQIAQRMTDTPDGARGGRKFWKVRPFTRVVRGWRAERTVRDYIQLNECEVTGRIPYQKARLRGLTLEQRAGLWVQAVDLRTGSLIARTPRAGP